MLAELLAGVCGRDALLAERTGDLERVATVLLGCVSEEEGPAELRGASGDGWGVKPRVALPHPQGAAMAAREGEEGEIP